MSGQDARFALSEEVANGDLALLTGDRSERYELPIVSRFPIYARPAFHADAHPPADAFYIIGNAITWIGGGFASAYLVIRLGYELFHAVFH